jgi:hypothetical protein
VDLRFKNLGSVKTCNLAEQFVIVRFVRGRWDSGTRWDSRTCPRSNRNRLKGLTSIVGQLGQLGHPRLGQTGRCPFHHPRAASSHGVGAEVLTAGGDCVDAVVATTFALGVLWRKYGGNARFWSVAVGACRANMAFVRFVRGRWDSGFVHNKMDLRGCWGDGFTPSQTPILGGGVNLKKVGQV